MGERLLLEPHVGVEIDLGRLHGLVAEPERNDGRCGPRPFAASPSRSNAGYVVGDIGATPSVPGPLPGTCPSTWFIASSVTPRCRPRPFMCAPNGSACSMPGAI